MPALPAGEPACGAQTSAEPEPLAQPRADADPKPTAVAAGPSESEQEPAKARRHDARIPWAELLQRVFLENVLACPCGGRRKIIAFLKESAAVKAILQSLGLPATGPPLAPARSALCPEEGWQDDVPAVQRSLQLGARGPRRAQGPCFPRAGRW